MTTIRELRKQKGMSQAELARILPVDPSLLSKYERSILPWPNHLITLAEDILNNAKEPDTSPAPPRKRPLPKKRMIVCVYDTVIGGYILFDIDARTSEEAEEWIHAYYLQNGWPYTVSGIESFVIRPYKNKKREFYIGKMLPPLP